MWRWHNKLKTTTCLSCPRFFVSWIMFSFSRSNCLASKHIRTTVSNIRPVEIASAPCKYTQRSPSKGKVKSFTVKNVQCSGSSNWHDTKLISSKQTTSLLKPQTKFGSQTMNFCIDFGYITSLFIVTDNIINNVVVIPLLLTSTSLFICIIIVQQLIFTAVSS